MRRLTGLEPNPVSSRGSAALAPASALIMSSATPRETDNSCNLCCARAMTSLPHTHRAIVTRIAAFASAYTHYGQRVLLGGKPARSGTSRFAPRYCEPCHAGANTQSDALVRSAGRSRKRGLGSPKPPTAPPEPAEGFYATSGKLLAG